MVKDGFDTRLFSSQISNTFAEYLRYNRRSRLVLLEEQANKLAVELQIQATGEGPATRAEIQSLPVRLGYHIKRRLARGLSKNPNRKGNKSLAATIERGATAAGRAHVTVAEEIALRLRWAGFYQASGWLTTKLSLSRGRTRIPNPRGKVIINGNQLRPIISLVNQTPRAAEFAARTGYVLRAVNNRIKDMQAYIARKMREQAAELSKARPNFSGKAAA